MSTTKEHYCDLCSDRVHEWCGTPRAVSKPGVGILFVGRGRFEKRRVKQAEHHLCVDCLRNIKDMLASQFSGFDFADSTPSDTSQGEES